MGASKEYRDYILERLGTVTAVRSRGMFGGFGIYVDDAMFGLISSDDAFYLKVDEQSVADYEAAEMPQFMNMPYYQLPVEALEDDQQLHHWVATAVEVGIRTKKPKKKKK